MGPDPHYADDFLREHTPKPPRVEGISAPALAVAVGAAMLAVLR